MSKIRGLSCLLGRAEDGVYYLALREGTRGGNVEVPPELLVRYELARDAWIEVQNDLKELAERKAEEHLEAKAIEMQRRETEQDGHDVEMVTALMREVGLTGIRRLASKTPLTMAGYASNLKHVPVAVHKLQLSGMRVFWYRRSTQVRVELSEFDFDKVEG